MRRSQERLKTLAYKTHVRRHGSPIGVEETLEKERDEAQKARAERMSPTCTVTLPISYSTPITDTLSFQ